MKQRASAGAGTGMLRLGQGPEVDSGALDAAIQGGGGNAGAADPTAFEAGRMDASQRRVGPGPWRCPVSGPTYAALDLGTNNCRLLIARPARREPGPFGFRIVDSFSRIVRLGEGLTQTGRLSEAAISRTVDALAICREKME